MKQAEISGKRNPPHQKQNSHFLACAGVRASAMRVELQTQARADKREPPQREQPNQHQHIQIEDEKQKENVNTLLQPNILNKLHHIVIGWQVHNRKTRKSKTLPRPPPHLLAHTQKIKQNNKRQQKKIKLRLCKIFFPVYFSSLVTDRKNFLTSSTSISYRLASRPASCFLKKIGAPSLSTPFQYSFRRVYIGFCCSAL